MGLEMSKNNKYSFQNRDLRIRNTESSYVLRQSQYSIVGLSEY